MNKCNRCGIYLSSHLTFCPICNKVKRIAPAKPFGPGTELAKLIPSILNSSSCNCKQYARQMDKWGVKGCEERFDEIVNHLITQAKKLLIPQLISKPIAKTWLTEAIDNCRPPSQERNGMWYVAVTTAPRKECTLEQCVESLRKCGWEPTIFAEPNSTIINANYIWNTHKKGVWHNWLDAARVALESNAEMILTVQDDSLFHPDSKTFMESIEWPSRSAGFVSLYTPKHYTINRRGEWRNTGINQISTSSLWGACALVWQRETLETLVNHKFTKLWLGARPRSGNKEVYNTRKENPSMIANSDTAIGMILAKMNKNFWFVDPSPVSHIAKYSTIAHGSNDGRRNAIRIADHNISLMDQVFPK